VDNPAKAQAVQDKMTKTNIKRYGYPYAPQNPDIFKKQQDSSFRIHRFKDTELKYNVDI
jgi:hypothetical protein